MWSTNRCWQVNTWSNLGGSGSDGAGRGRLMDKAIVLAVAACVCTATSSLCQRKGARDNQTTGFDVRLIFRLARQPVWLVGIASDNWTGVLEGHGSPVRLMRRQHPAAKRAHRAGVGARYADSGVG